MRCHQLVNAFPVSWWLSLLAVVPSSNAAGDATTPGRAEPEVIVEMEKSGVLVDGALWLRVVLDNGVPGCRPVVVSQQWAGFTDGYRPETLVDFEILDEKGDRLSRSGRLNYSRPPYVSGDVILLGCGAVYGWHMAVGKLDWQYNLGPGKYRLRARVENRVRAYLDRHPAEVRSLARGMRLDLVPQAIRDFSVVSEELAIEVSAKDVAER
jgi:hypothetical protein